jgi:serine/threonine protein kinase
MKPELLMVEDALERFQREAQAAARLNHPNIVAVYDFGPLSCGGAYLVMELLRGQSLHTELQEYRRLKPKRVMMIMRQICAALHVAHQEGIIHRDLKPANIMLCRMSGDEEVVKLLDFGLAKFCMEQSEPNELTLPGMALGTVKYMSPEQARGESVDQRADIFALGVIVHQLLTGDYPFPGKTPSEILAAIQHLPPRPLQEVWSEATPTLQAVITKSLAKNPDDRYPSVALFGWDLAQALGQVAVKDLGD